MYAILTIYIFLIINLLQCNNLYVHASCALFNNCNGHGKCDLNSKCICDPGWGAITDVTDYKSPDCSAKTCPAGKSWGDIPTSASAAHKHTECSSKGICDRKNGKCKCLDGFDGASCDRKKCLNDCSGHGLCLSMRNLAKRKDALPLSDNFDYNDAWDSDMSYGCLCDSSWSVGLGPGETQTPEWFGPDCSLRHCPSGDDFVTTIDERNCSYKIAEHTINVTGLVGNLCHVDCSNRGKCDHGTGLCHCFRGAYGVACEKNSALARDDSRAYEGINLIISLIFYYFF